MRSFAVPPADARLAAAVVFDILGDDRRQQVCRVWDPVPIGDLAQQAVGSRDHPGELFSSPLGIGPVDVGLGVFEVAAQRFAQPLGEGVLARRPNDLLDRASKQLVGVLHGAGAEHGRRVDQGEDLVGEQTLVDRLGDGPSEQRLIGVVQHDARPKQREGRGNRYPGGRGRAPAPPSSRDRPGSFSPTRDPTSSP